MGKGTIISGGTGGEYSVQLSMSKDRVQEQIDDLTTKIDILGDAIDDAEDTIDDLEDEALALQNEIDLLGSGSAKDAKVKELVKKQNEVLVARLSKDMLELKKTSCEKKIEYLESHVPEEDPTVTAWCADLTEDLSGDVGTIEVPGERGTVLIQPGYDSNAVYDSERDGQLESAVAGTPSGTFYNLAMLPGWQKWMPTYRFGTISNLDKDADTCDVTLESALSSQQELSVNQSNCLSDVPIEYMNCNSSVFVDGDLVLVEFEGQDWDSPKVIGFQSNPKHCAINILINDIVPMYWKQIKVVDSEDNEFIFYSTEEEPDKLTIDGTWAGIVWPAKFYLGKIGGWSGYESPLESHSDLFQYWCEVPNEINYLTYSFYLGTYQDSTFFPAPPAPEHTVTVTIHESSAQWHYPGYEISDDSRAPFVGYFEPLQWTSAINGGDEEFFESIPETIEFTAKLLGWIFTQLPSHFSGIHTFEDLYPLPPNDNGIDGIGYAATGINLPPGYPVSTPYDHYMTGSTPVGSINDNAAYLWSGCISGATSVAIITDENGLNPSFGTTNITLLYEGEMYRSWGWKMLDCPEERI